MIEFFSDQGIVAFFIGVINIQRRDENMNSDITWMQKALELAEYAGKNKEVPVGAVLVLNQEIIGTGWNHPISTHDPTAHAEIMALRHGAEYLKNYRLIDTTLFVTLEPCAMCVGAIIHARIARLVFGAFDPRSGAVQSTVRLLNEKHFNHQVEWQGGVLAQQCGLVLKEFFQERR